MGIIYKITTKMKKIFLLSIIGMFLLIGISGLVSAFNWDDGALTAYYKLDEDSVSGGTFYDALYSANGTNALAGNGTGILYSSYYFNGTSYMNITSPHSYFPSSTSLISVSLWVYQNQTDALSRYIFSMGRVYNGTGGFGFDIVRNNGGLLEFQTIGAGNIISTSTNISELQEQWVHIVATRTNESGVNLWVNGVSVANGTVSSMSIVNSLVYLGSDSEISSAMRWVGKIDEVGIWNRTLTGEEIGELYSKGYGLEYGLSSGLSSILVNLTSPKDKEIISSSNYYFIVNLSMSGINNSNYWANNTYNIWYSNGTLYNKTTVIGLSGNSTSTNKSFNLDTGNFLWNAYACYGNLTYSNCSWSYNGNYSFSVNSTINSETHNDLTFETITSELYSLNITSPTIPTNAYLIYNGTSYSATVTNTVGNFYTISRSLQLPSSLIGTSQFYYKWNLSSTFGENSTNYTQTVAPIQFGLCNTTLTIPYLNFTFKDEATMDYVTASIPSSTFVYYLGDGSINKTLTFINNSENKFYAFCALPSNKTYYVDTYLQYKNGTDYPQRIYDPDVLTYTNATTNTTLYLLSSIDGIYVTFQIVNTADQVINGVEVSATRTIDSVEVEVASGTTGADGTVTFWLNPDFSHDFTFSKSGYTTYETSLIPTQSSYTITLSSSASTVSDDYTKGMKPYIYPKSRELLNDTSYNFIFNLTSRIWELDSFGFSLRLANGTIVGTDSSTTEGSGASITYNTNNQTIIYIDYYWVVEGNYTNGTSYWIVTNSLNTGWSIKTFFTDLNLVLDSGLFGLDNFGRYLLSFLVLFMVVGVMGYKFGTTSPLFISITIFAVVFFLDVVTGLIPAIRGIDNVLTYLAGVILFVTIIAEVAR